MSLRSFVPVMTGVLLSFFGFIGSSGAEASFLDGSQNLNKVYRYCPADDRFQLARYRGEVLVPSGQRRFEGRHELWFVSHVSDRSSFWVARQDLCVHGVQDSFAIIVDKGANRLHAVHGHRLLRSFPVGTGRVQDGYFTPEGFFRVGMRERCPLYYGETPERPKPGCAGDNPLGSAALWFLGRTYGIHGTDRPELISQASTTAEDRRVSKGCLRLQNRHVEWLYRRTPKNTPVWIRSHLSVGNRGGEFEILGLPGKRSRVVVKLNPGTRYVYLRQLTTGAEFVLGDRRTEQLRFLAFELPVGSFRGKQGFTFEFMREHQFASR